MAQVVYLPLTPLVGSPPSGTTAVHFDAAGLGLAPAALAVKVTLVSPAAAITNAAGTVIARGGTATLDGSGLLDVALEQNALLSDAASTYTIQVGDSIFSGLVVPPSGPVNLSALVAVTTDHTVVVTARVGGPDQGPDANLLANARLSIDCTDLDGTLRLARTEVQALSDTGGLLTWRLERTDQLTPVAGAGEPYYTFRIADSVYYRHVRAGGGVVPLLPLALPTAGDGTVGVPVFGPSGAGHTVGLVPDPGAVAGTQRFLREDSSFGDPNAAVTIATLVGPLTVNLPSGVGLVLCDVAAGNITITLPDDAADHRAVCIKRISSSIVAHTVTISPGSGAQWDEGQTTVASLQGRNEAVRLLGHYNGSHVHYYTLDYAATLNAEGIQSGGLALSGAVAAAAIQTNNLSQNFGASLVAMLSGQDYDNPAIAAGAAAGTGPTFSTPLAHGTDLQGHVTFTSGTAPTTGKLCTITLVNASFTFSKLVFCAFVQGRDAATAALGLYAVENTTSGAAFDVYCAVAPAASTAYDFKYVAFRQ